MAALGRALRLTEVLLRIMIELFFALGTTEVIRLPLLLASSVGGCGFYIHATHRIFHGCCVLHCHLSLLFVFMSPCAVSGNARGPSVIRMQEDGQ